MIRGGRLHARDLAENWSTARALARSLASRLLPASDAEAGKQAGRSVGRPGESRLNARERRRRDTRWTGEDRAEATRNGEQGEIRLLA